MKDNNPLTQPFKTAIKTTQAPAPIGTYSQAIQTGSFFYISGQLGKNPDTGHLITDDFKAETEQVFKNLSAVCKACGGDLNHLVKLTIFMTDLSFFSIVNETMQTLFSEPYPARSTFQVAALPAGARIEIEGVMAAGISR